MRGQSTLYLNNDKISRLSTVVNCDRILVLADGRVAESGTHDQLLAQEESLYASESGQVIRIISYSPYISALWRSQHSHSPIPGEYDSQGGHRVGGSDFHFKSLPVVC